MRQPMKIIGTYDNGLVTLFDQCPDRPRKVGDIIHWGDEPEYYRVFEDGQRGPRMCCVTGQVEVEMGMVEETI